MRKRILSLLLVACMLLPCLPLAAFPALASEASEAELVTVTFQMADGRVVCQRQLPPGYAYIASPSEAELTAAGVTEAEQADIIGWYYVAPNGTYYDIGAYTRISPENDIVVTPYMKTSTFQYDGSKQMSVPVFDKSVSDVVTPLVAWNGGFTLGYVSRATPTADPGLAATVKYKYNSDTYLQLNGDLWGYGGIYLNKSGNIGFAVPPDNNKRNVVLSWHALVTGTVTVAVDRTKTECYLVITKNNEVIWPVRGEGETAVNLADQTTWSVSGATDDVSTFELSVTAGDDIRFMMARTANTSTNPVGMWPTITYTSDLSAPEFSDEIVKNLTTSFDANKPTFDAETGKASFNGNWQLVHYASKDAIARMPLPLAMPT